MRLDSAKRSFFALMSLALLLGCRFSFSLFWWRPA
jgi:hypothetical protein